MSNLLMGLMSRMPDNVSQGLWRVSEGGDRRSSGLRRAGL